MKNLFIYLLFFILFFTTGCSESFLNTEDLTSKNDSNFPTTYDELNQSLMSVYAAQRNAIGGGQPWARPGMFFYSNLLSDDWIASGGPNDLPTRAAKVWKYSDIERNTNVWSCFYNAIYRANYTIEKCDQVPDLTTDEKNKVLGQAFYLRGSCFFDLCRTYNQVPLTLSTVPKNLPKASVDELYGAIAKDLKNAIEMLPAVAFNNLPKSEYGLATKWAAQALMARVFLFYTGYYEKTALPLPDGNSVTKEDVIGWLEDCIANSGHALVSDFRNLWPYSYLSKDVYKFNGAHGGFSSDAEWRGESGDNEEVIYSIHYSVVGNHQTNGNVFLQFAGQPYNLIPWGRGWGHLNVNTNFYAKWPDEDLRKKATICDLKDTTESVLNHNGQPYNQFVPNVNIRNQTGLFVKKATRINLLGPNGKYMGMSTIYGRTPSNNERELFQNLVTMRFSDILLMAAELGSSNALTYLNMVRERAGLPPSPNVNLEVIKNERMYEFAFEGVRFYDLLRWHDYESAVNAMDDIPVIDKGVPTSLSYKGTFNTETGGFLYIPQSQISLSEGNLEQNPGWDGSAIYSGN